MATVLVVDDERNILKVMKANLSHHGFEVLTAQSAEEAWMYFNRCSHLDLVITDYKLTGMNGLELLKKIRAVNPMIPVLIITAYGKIKHAVEAMKSGANNYLTKPLDYDEVIAIIRHTLRTNPQNTQETQVESWQRVAQKVGIVTRSQVMQVLVENILLVSKAASNVLVSGESGTGKELVARAIHQLSDRRKNPFVPVDCATIPGELIENELFGHEKGAYTGAFNSEIGKIELAEDGTLFLDEIGEMPKPLQAKLLRVLQEREFYRISGKRPREMKCRVIAATNLDLEQEVSKGRFREDLYYRLNVIPIRVPPLRKRKEDIVPLSTHFLQEFAQENLKELQGFEKAVLEIFMAYNWPGNVRELKNTIERAVVMSRFNTIVVGNLPTRLQKLAEMNPDMNATHDDLHLPSIERSVIVQALERANWNQTNAARILGISRKQLRTKMKRFHLLK